MDHATVRIVALAVGIPLFVMAWAFFLAAAVQSSPQQPGGEAEPAGTRATSS